MQIIKGPDFPTGATILGRDGINSFLLNCDIKKKNLHFVLKFYFFLWCI